MKDDLRAETTSGQPFVHAAPLNIVYVADADRLEEKSAENRNIAGVADTAMVGQNSARNRGPCSRVVGRARIGVARACRMGFSRHRRGSAVARRTVRDFGDPTRAVEKLSQISINREGARLIAIPAIRCRPNHANTDT